MNIDSAASRSRLIPLVSLWDFFGGRTFGMAQLFRGLQGDGSLIHFDQLMYKSRLGRRMPAPARWALRQAVDPLRNRSILQRVSREPWVLGGGQFLQTIHRSYLNNAMVVVFDLLNLDFPELRGQSPPSDYSNIRHAGMVVTTSLYTKQRVVAHFDLDPDRIQVVAIGVDTERFRPFSADERAEARRRFELPDDASVVVYIGSEQRRKNVPTVVRALARLKERIPNLLFVKVGMPQSESGRAAFDRALDETGMRAHTRLVDYAADADIPSWYNAADLFVFPSVGEGFGVPVIESLACGTPTLTTRCSSIPEVGGTAALTVADPYDHMEWASVMAAVLTNREVQTKLREVGPAQAQRFTWQPIREQFSHLFTSLANQSSPGRSV